MTDKTIFIHAGGSKAGSSALQRFFYSNALRLVSFDFAFENRRRANNGLILYKALSSALTTDNEIDSLVLSYFGQCSRAICSSEFLQLMDARGWRKLLESLERLGIALKVIFYVRNVLPFLLSNYDQVIKCSGESQLFDQWAITAGWHHAEALRVFANELPQSCLQVLHYDQERENLIRGFLDILEVDSTFEVDKNDLRRLVNRSLNKEERRFLLEVNKALGQSYSKELTQLLISINPNELAEPVSYQQATADTLLDRFGSEVDWVNNTFFNGQTVVSVLPIEPENDKCKSSLPKCPQHNGIQRHVLNWALEKLKTIQSETEQRIVKTLNNAAQGDSGQSHPDLPVDFDALAYLLINPDVLYAGFDPVQHYLIHGKQEERVYRY